MRVFKILKFHNLFSSGNNLSISSFIQKMLSSELDGNLERMIIKGIPKVFL